jgi:hypothetical protein
MLTYIPNYVKNVIGNVKLVTLKEITVPSVKVIELLPLDVSVQKVPSKDTKLYHSISVQLVTINVSLVKEKLISVLDVLKIEFIFQSVLVQWVNMKS